MALGQRPCLSVFGHDYPTSDGTCVRDYIHVMDLAEGHTAACDKLFATPKIGCIAYNLGTGTGTSVLEMIKVRQHISLGPQTMRVDDSGSVEAAQPALQ